MVQDTSGSGALRVAAVAMNLVGPFQNEKLLFLRIIVVTGVASGPAITSVAGPLSIALISTTFGTLSPIFGVSIVEEAKEAASRIEKRMDIIFSILKAIYLLRGRYVGSFLFKFIRAGGILGYFQ